MKKIIHIIDKISSGFGLLAGLLMLGGFLMVLTEIILRSFFSKTLYVTGEYTAYIMVGITFLGLAYTLKDKAHIRMTFLHSVLKGKAVVYLDIFAFTVGFLFFVLLTVTTTNFFLDSLATGSRSMQISRTLLAIPQSIIPVGTSIMALQFLGEMLKSVVYLRSGEWVASKIETK